MQLRRKRLTVSGRSRGALAIVLLEEGQVLAGGRVGREVLDSVIGSKDPAVLVLGKSLGVVQVHLDKVFCRI